MAQTKKNRFWITLLIILIVLAIFSIPLLSLIGNYLIVKDSLRKADLITSVSGPAYRAIYAADLCQSGLAPRLFYTGGFNENDQRYEAKWSEYLATLEGVPPEEIFIDDSTVNSTYQEAVRVKEYIDSLPDDQVKTIIVVTDAYHTRRARWAYQKVLGNQIKILMAPVPFDKAGYSQKWWANSVSRQMVPEEYFKLTFYLFRYQLTSGPLQKWLARFDKF
jgi:uncharacterized SAM-binding protein YcdF (DUF218 family)